jgi:hypothetical protein
LAKFWRLLPKIHLISFALRGSGVNSRKLGRDCYLCQLFAVMLQKLPVSAEPCMWIIEKFLPG